MGYDYSNKTVELYTSYNHGWAFYAYLDEKDGIRWIYGKQGKDIIPRLETVLESLEKLIEPDVISYTKFGNFRLVEYGVKDQYDGYFGKDGWDCSDFHSAVKNAHANVNMILAAAKESPLEEWHGD